MEKYVISVELEDSAEYVAKLLEYHKLSCVPVVDPTGKCFGVISATDFVHFFNAHLSPKTVHAWEVCTHKVIEISPDTTIESASKLMIDHKIHHLVITQNDVIKGIVSSIDLIKKCLSNTCINQPK